MIRIEALKKQFGRVQALKSIDMTVNAGDIYGFIGPNGAGKTTTLRILMGILKADSGQASIFQKDAWKDALSLHHKIAYVPGDVNLWPNLTGGEVIDLFLEFRGKKDNDTKDALIKAFNVDPTKKCRSLSKGNKQKIALIAAFASDADLYVFDEPTTGLDPLMEKVFHTYVKAAQKEGKTVLLSSHRLDEVEKLCTKISIIREGEIIESGSIDELRHLTRMNVTLESDNDLSDLSALKGVHGYERNGRVHTLEVAPTSMQTLINALGNKAIHNFKSTPPTLEDLFIRHYDLGDA